MQVSVEEMQGLERRLKVAVPVEQVNKLVDEQFQKIGKTARLDGFRPGKVPRSILEAHYGHGIRHQEVAPKLINETLWPAFEKAEVAPIGRPMIEEFVLNANEPLNYSVLFEVAPEFDLKDLTGVEVEEVASEVTDADVSETLEKMRFEKATWTEVVSPAANNDLVTVSYTVTVDGEEIPQEEAKDTVVHLGNDTSKTVIPELKAQLVGVVAGDEKTLTATYPADYPATSIAGKAAQFALKVTLVKHPTLPALDDEFAKQFDNAANLDELRKNVREDMVYYLKMAVKNINKTHLFRALRTANPITLPKSMVHLEIESMGRAFFRNMMRQDKVSDEMLRNAMPFFEKMYAKAAEERVSLSLLLTKFIEKHPQDITDEMIMDAAKERSVLYEDPEAWIKEYLESPRNKEDMRQMLLEIGVADQLAASATRNVVNLNYFAVSEKEREIREGRFADLHDDEGHGEEEHVHDEHCQHDH